MSKSVRAKFYVSSVTPHRYADGIVESESVQMWAVTSYSSEENKAWSQYTPSGSLSMNITNPACFGAFEVGREAFAAVNDGPPAWMK